MIVSLLSFARDRFLEWTFVAVLHIETEWYEGALLQIEKNGPKWNIDVLFLRHLIITLLERIKEIIRKD